jgi:hypothetical protein
MEACVERRSEVEEVKEVKEVEDMAAETARPGISFEIQETARPATPSGMQHAHLGKQAVQEESEGRSEDRPLQEAAAPEKRSWFGANWLGLGKARAALRKDSGQAEKMPHIVHVDVDAFFASVEQVLKRNFAA